MALVSHDHHVDNSDGRELKHTNFCSGVRSKQNLTKIRKSIEKLRVRNSTCTCA